ncbi:glycine zipper 2TM domain-containing protein [Telluria mixta]|jgi:uncharacterized protein YcfJ|uniref:glycine zipper 2TM domain-containing protein n=1 Tax=Telluria mixta TaxID=34071 RepID=UPI00247A820C|nr:glycine zipper 2TM domain-containing protein [Telluria mixta]WEM96322.1 glycine zipper 2TM domain-containing protein [Telluria mixta]
METIKTATSRIHPLVAAAAVSVIVVSLAGTAAITGLLPSSHSAPEAAPTQVNPAYAAAPALPMAADATAPQGLQPVQGAYAQPAPVAYAQPAVASAQPAPAPTVIKETIIKEVPAKPAPRHTTHHTSYAHNDAPSYREPAPRPAPQPAQPNYVAIGTGAVVGGLLGNQVGSGNGRKLATVAGIIGGGMLGNQIANQNQGR